MISTTVEQSKKLLSLGLKPETSDMYWDFQEHGYILIADELGYYKNDSEIPSWSLSTLLGLMPDIENNKPSIRKVDNSYCCVYSDFTGGDLYWYYSSTPVNAAFEMMCWLLENKKV